MENEEEIKFYFYIIASILGIIGYFIRNRYAKKHIKEMESFAEKHNYVFITKPDDKIISSLALPGIIGQGKVFNYLELKDKKWTAIWGKCERVIKLKDMPKSTSTSSFIIFKFDNIIIPEFEITDNRVGLLNSVTNFFSEKVIKLDKGFSDSYTLKGNFETQIKKFFTPKVKSAFISMDKNHLPSERNMSVKDLGNLITGHTGNTNGMQFYGKDKKIYVFGCEKTTLFELQNFYKIASGIANAVVQDAASKAKPFSGYVQEEPKDDLSSFLANQEAQFSNAPAPGAINMGNKAAQLEETNQFATNQFIQNTQTEEDNNNNQFDYTQQIQNVNEPYENNSYVEQHENISSYQETGFDNNNNMSPTDQLVLLSAMMIIDKDIHKNELRNIVEYGLSLGLEKAKIEQIVNLAKNQPNNLLRSVKMANIPKNDQVMRMLIRVAFADGKIAKEELELIRFVAKRMNFSEIELKTILEEEKNNFRR